MVEERTAEFLLSKQKRCVECGSASLLEIHHRIFRSQGQQFLTKFLMSSGSTDSWSMDDVQNLVVLCKQCHTGRIHNGDNALREKYSNSYTCPKSGMNTPLIRPERNILSFL